MIFDAQSARKVLENSTLALCRVDSNATILFANSAFQQLMSMPAEKLEGKNLGDFLEHESCRDWREICHNAVSGTLKTDRATFSLAEGMVSVEVGFEPVMENGRTDVCLMVNKVISGTDKTEIESLPVKDVLEEASVGVFINDHQGRIHYANRAALMMLGYTLTELKRLTIEDIDVEYTLDDVQNMVGRLKQHERDEYVFYTRHRRKDGSCYDVEVNINRSRHRDYVFSYFKDISQIREQEKHRDQLSFIVEKANDAVYIFDEHRNIVYANELASQNTGYTREELLRMNIADLDPVRPGLSPEQFQERAQRGGRLVFETHHVAKDGTRIPVEVSLVSSIFDGKVFNSAFVRDIRERTRQLEEMEELRFALENASDAIYLHDRKGVIHFANDTACRQLGYNKSELIGMNVADLDPDFSIEAMEEVWQKTELRNRPPLKSNHCRKDGSFYPVEIVVSASSFGDKEYAVAFVRDITERVQAEEALQAGEERFRIIADTSPVALIISKVSDGSIQYANKQAELLFEKNHEQLIRLDFGELLGAAGVEPEEIAAILEGDMIMNREVCLDRDDDMPVWVSVNTSSIELQGEKLMCSAMLDVTEAKELSNQLSYHATFDDLTGLVNRREFEDRLQEVIDLAHRRDTENTLCYMDLDQFKIINDTCGHMAGDEMLRQISQVIYQCVRRDDTLARLGGDEFGILLEHCNLENAEMVANKIRQVVQEFRFMWRGRTFNISVSIGLVPIAREGETISEVMRRADTACYAAKDSGRNKLHVFRFDDQELAQRHGEMQWVSRITTALDHGRLELWKQKIAPVHDVDGDNGHYELLLRMRDEQDNLILPGAFLPAAERYDLAPRIDLWVVRQIFEWLSSHPDELDSLSTCAINISGQTLGNAEFLQEIARSFEKSVVPPHKICFEITETSAIVNLTNAAQFMNMLKSLGCVFALDDFGSGLSSFAYLKNLPVDYVKIDGYFVKDVTSDPVDRAMVKAINDMAHAMGKLTIAEFVETREVLQVLIELGVDYVQGYGIARPSPLVR